MLGRECGDLLQHFPRIDTPGGIVGIDHDDRLGAVVDLPRDILRIGIPVRLLVAEIMNRPSSREIDRCGPERIIRRGDQDLVPVVQESLHRHDDQLAHAVADVDILDIDAGDPLLLIVLHDGLAGREEPLGIGVSLGIGEIENHIVQDLVRSGETERGGIPDVQLQDLIPLLLEPLRFLQYRAPDVVTDIVELLRFLETPHASCSLCRATLNRAARCTILPLETGSWQASAAVLSDALLSDEPCAPFPACRVRTMPPGQARKRSPSMFLRPGHLRGTPIRSLPR